MRHLIGAGYLGSKPVHMESYYGYDLGFGAYAKALLADRQHWVRALPGRLLHNIISHGVARVAEYLESERPEVVTVGFVSPHLRELGERELVDEIRVIITENQKTTAYLTVSSQARPLLNQFHAFGTKNGLSMDQQKQTVIRHKGKAYPSYAEQFIPSLSYSSQYLSNFWHNFSLFRQNRFHQKQSMRHLAENLYEAVRGNAGPPIPYREILLTTRIMDDIFQQLYRDQRPK
jgi:predicted dehydrogenase